MGYGYGFSKRRKEDAGIINSCLSKTNKIIIFFKLKKKVQVPPRFELGSLDSESRVLTITPWNLAGKGRQNIPLYSQCSAHAQKRYFL